MAAEIPTKEPLEIRAGDTVKCPFVCAWVLKEAAQPSRELLGTLLHECIHLLADDMGKPDWPEDRVIEWEEKMRDVVWQAGFRKVVD